MTTGTTGLSTTGITPASGQPGGSTTDAAKEQAAQVGQTAREAGGQVASTAKDEARNVAGEARNQARDLMQQTQSQMREQAGAQKAKAADGLRGLGGELRALAQGQQPAGGTGKVSGLAEQAADAVNQLASWLDAREPGDVLDEVRDFARRRPGAFLLGAAAAGVLAGRLTRGAVDAKRSEQGGTGGAGPSYAAGPQPSYGPDLTTTAPQPTAGYAATGGGVRPGDEAIVVEEAVVVETDPFGPRSERRVGGGDLP